MNRIFVVVLAVALAGLGACSTPRYSAELLRTPIDAPYQLASGDRLRVIVFGQDNLSNSFSVHGAGNVAMPLIGLVHAQGLTTAQFGKVVEGKLRQGFLRDPSVSVEVEAYRPFFVLGEVTVAGQYPFVNGMTAQNAIAVAGGFTRARPGQRRPDADDRRAAGHRLGAAHFRGASRRHYSGARTVLLGNRVTKKPSFQWISAMAPPEPHASKLRIVHVFRAPLGGLFRHVVDLAAEQRARGHDVGMFFDAEARCPRVEAALARIPGGLTLGVAASPIRRNPGFGDLVAMARLSAYLRRVAPDIVHGHGSKGGLYARLSR